MLLLTDERIKLQVDVGWMLYSYVDPVDFLRRYSHRVRSVHLKDIIHAFRTPDRHHCFAAVGTGAIPLRSILRQAARMDLMENGIVIDQDAATPGHTIFEDYVTGVRRIKEAPRPAAITPAVFTINARIMAEQEDLSLPEAFTLTHKMGYRGFYLSSFELDPRNSAFLHCKPYEGDLLALAAVHGLPATGMFTFWETQSDSALPPVKEAIDFAQANQVHHLLVVPMLNDLADGPLSSERMDWLCANLTELCAYAAEREVQLELEDGDSENVLCSEMDFLQVLSRVPGLRMALDTGNFLYGYHDVKKAYQLLESYITDVHLKDRGISGDENGCRKDGTKLYNAACGEGIIPVEEILGWLTEDGYQGNVNVELMKSSRIKQDMEVSVRLVQETQLELPQERLQGVL